MTERQSGAGGGGPVREHRPRRRRPDAFPVAAGSLAAFLGVFSYMAFELRSGHDPALSKQSTAATRPQRVVVKRIERRIVITKVLPEATTAASGSPGSASAAPTAAAAPAPAQTSAPVVIQRAAPAPAPAPVTTRTS